MSSKDKTREKLVGSMRKTKADAGIGDKKKPASSEPGQSSTKQKSAKPAAKRGKSTTQKSQQTHTNIMENYQSGRRVWPD